MRTQAYVSRYTTLCYNIQVFVKPDGLTDIQFEEQLKNHDSEIEKWKSALESIST
jgi:hypothetical protein